ncbi:hypothetical protein WP50_25110 [Lactiplantibacillus plantarum]|nr:hypothetical protein WP50_25110 [Lactiplantibacillus plantarum]
MVAQRPHIAKQHFDFTRFSSIGRALIVGVIAGIVVSIFRFSIEQGLRFTIIMIKRGNSWWHSGRTLQNNILTLHGSARLAGH